MENDRPDDLLAEGPDHVIVLRDGGLGETTVESIAIASLRASYSPRVSGENDEYSSALAASEATLPPIIVHRASMNVIDGMHRLRAAEMRGQRTIEVRFFDGTTEEAYLLAVAMNVTHGLPLSQADRTAAARRILADHPQWSDRAIAEVAGLSASKISQLRGEMKQTTDSGVRIGRDGRVRPVDPAQGRELARRLITDNPEASVREIARRAGISPTTVADVRCRMLGGVDPVTPRQRRAGPHPVSRRPISAGSDRSLAELRAISHSLSKDPSLRYTDLGRSLLRMFEACTAVGAESHRIALSIPEHCKQSVLELLVGYCEIWQLIADELCQNVA